MVDTINSKDIDDDDRYNAFLDVLSTLPVRKLEEDSMTDDADIVPSFAPNADVTHPKEPRAEMAKHQQLDRSQHAQEKPAQDNQKGKDGGLIGPLSKFYLIYLGIPSVLVAWYAAAILFPPDYRANYPALLWTDGALTYEEEDDGTTTTTICPREAICSEGVLQIVLIAIARLTAFVSYIFMAFTFWSKMHNTSHMLSNTYFSTVLPLPHFHEVHKFTGVGYAVLAMLHAVGHFIRWMIRSEMYLFLERLGLSGSIAILSMLVVIFSMSSLAKRVKLPFEKRILLHWLFLLLQISLCFHTRRCMIITLFITGLWLLDYLYGWAFRTHRIEVAEFTPLPNFGGAQMLWRNPAGFKGNSGEYVKVRLPWLSKGGKEWHPFSIYLREATEEGLDGVLSKKELNRTRVILGGENGRRVVPEKTAVIMVEMQNEFASEGGKLHDKVKDIMESNDMLRKTADLLVTARSVGAHIIHAPIVFDKRTVNPNMNVGVLKACTHGNYFERGTWGSQIVDSHTPKLGDHIVNGKVGIDSFIGTDLLDILEKYDIDTVIIGGFPTNSCVDSTMRTAYEKGFNVITLVDGTACDSMLQQKATTSGSFKLFSTPMTCEEATHVLTAASKVEEAMPMHNLDLEGEDTAMFKTDVKSFINQALVSTHKDHNREGLVLQEAREQTRSQYKTTQVFIAPIGDWTNQVYKDVSQHRQLRSCWIRGPYISPYQCATSFSSLVLTATGIGITPALGVMGQYRGNSKTKALIWSVRCSEMLKFFCPLICTDATIAIIYYTGKQKIPNTEVKRMLSKGNLIIYQERPNFQDVISTVITETTSVFREGQRKLNSKQSRPSILRRLSLAASASHRRAAPVRNGIENLSDMTPEERKHWAAFYCGGSQTICKAIKEYTTKNHIHFESEFFDW